MGGFFIEKLKIQRQALYILILISLLPSYRLLQSSISTLKERIAPGETILFKKRKNVWFLLFDGYTSNEGIRFLNINNDSFLQELSRRGFTTYDSFFTSRQPTVGAMFTFLDMKFSAPRTEKERRRIVAGHGRVYEIFKKNGYSTNIIHGSTYLIKNYCNANFCLPDSASFFHLFQLLDKIITNDLFDLFFDPEKQYPKSEEMYNIASKIAKRKNSHFSYFHYFKYPLSAFCFCSLEKRLSSSKRRRRNGQYY